MKKCKSIVQLSLLAVLATFGKIYSQTCYPTSLADNSKGTTTTIAYDEQQNITSVTTAMGQFQMVYSVTIIKGAPGYKKVFTAKSDNSPAMAFVITKITMVYNDDNRLLLIEGSNEQGVKSVERFSYNGTNQITRIDQEMSFKDPSGKVSTDKGQIVYSYASPSSRNPSEIKKFGIINNQPGLGLIEHDILTYDNNKAVSDEFPFSSGPIRTYAANNILTADITYVTSKQNVKQSYTYTFNEKGFPTSKTYQFSGASTTDVYKYECR